MTSVAIVAMGATHKQYLEAVAAAGGDRRRVADETWAINAMGDRIEHDRLFHMDDVAVQEARAPNNPYIAGLVRMLKKHPGPVYTSVVREGYPGLVAFPLQDAITKLGWPYFNTTTAYAFAFAILSGVRQVSLWGMDFIYSNGRKSEEGRSCLEYWIGFATARGMAIRVASRSGLLDMNRPLSRRLYGYDGMEIEIDAGTVRMTPRDLPTAAEIERRYALMHMR
ncbi:MAG: hypothetical protein KIS96_11740 [Bauldia sp.]|nr:hypothetical protein [Bauldia sp.]